MVSEPVLVHCFRYVDEDGMLVDRGFDVMMVKEGDLWDRVGAAA